MENVNVPRERLVGILTTNLARHVATHEKAASGYERKLIRVLQDALRKARKRKLKHLALHLPAPVSYAEHYREVIGMLKLSMDKTVELSAEDYQKYVRDEWSWKKNFLRTASVYGKA